MISSGHFLLPPGLRGAAAFALLLVAFGLAGCGEKRSGTPTTPGALDSGTAVELCVNSGCGERIELLAFPSAENLTFSDGGRLFVSGNGGIHEVTKDAAGAFSATLISEGCASGLGLAIRGNVLYAVCSGMKIFAGELSATPQLTEIFTLTGMCIPNGMALGADGNLYVVDEPLNFCVPDPSVVRLTIDPANPMNILSQETWLQGSPLGQLHLGLDNVLRFPNGLQSLGNRFFGTDGGSVYAVNLLPDGSAGPVELLFFEPTPHDDLGIAGDQLLVTDFAGGAIVLISQAGEFLDATDYATFSFPSSVRLGRPPMFEPGDIVVTETGVLGDNDLPIDFLSVFRRRAE